LQHALKLRRWNMRHVRNCISPGASSAALILLLVLKVTAQEPWLSKGERVKVDYDKPDAVTVAITRAAFDSVKLAIRSQDIPLGGAGRVTNEVFEIDFGRLVFDKDLPAELGKRGLAFADPLTAILYAARFPNRQRMHPINILFTDRQGQLCYLLLGGGPDRRFGTRLANPGHWGPGARFLVIRKGPLQQRSQLKNVPQSSGEARVSWRTEGPRTIFFNDTCRRF